MRLQTINAKELMNTVLPPTNFVIKNLISEGLHIIGGAPKIGKSWMALWLCLQVTKGEKVWEFETTKSTALYLCLEDGFKRIQDRLFDITDEAPETLHFATKISCIGEGFEEEIEEFIKEYPDTKLIVVDTLQKIRGKRTRSSNMYEDDYEEISAIKRLADKHNIAIITVHHLRKAKDADPINMLSGSTGISGSADAIMILQKDERTENVGKLTCVGRDIETINMDIEFDKNTFVWNQLKPIELRNRTVDESIVKLCEFIKNEKTFVGIASELTEKLNEGLEIEYFPSTLKKNIIKNIDFLADNSIRYLDKRNAQRKEFMLEYFGEAE